MFCHWNYKVSFDTWYYQQEKQKKYWTTKKNLNGDDTIMAQK